VKILTPLVAAAVALAAVACSSPPAETDGTSQEKWETQAVFDQMDAVIEGIDYLPFQYRVDGCYARALYMSMELASNQLESNALFVFAPPGQSLVVGSVQWGYHVAPMIEVGSDPSSLVPMVVDPSMSSVPLTQQQGISQMGYPYPNEPDYPTTLMVPGSDYAPGEAENEPSYRNEDMPSFADLPPFHLADISNACAVMFSYVQDEGQLPGVTEDVGAKQDRLVNRTSALVQALQAVGKLDANGPPFSPDNCRLGVATN
jgi:hypothetical protein